MTCTILVREGLVRREYRVAFLTYAGRAALAALAAAMVRCLAEAQTELAAIKAGRRL